VIAPQALDHSQCQRASWCSTAEHVIESGTFDETWWRKAARFLRELATGSVSWFKRMRGRAVMRRKARKRRCSRNKYRRNSAYFVHDLVTRPLFRTNKAGVDFASAATDGNRIVAFSSPVVSQIAVGLAGSGPQRLFIVAPRVVHGGSAAGRGSRYRKGAGRRRTPPIPGIPHRSPS